MKPYYDKDGITIYCGDCFEVLHELSGVGAVVTDPPYSSGGAYRSDRARQTSDKYVSSEMAPFRPEFSGDSRDQRAFLVWSAMWMSAARQACVDGAVLVSFTDWRQLPTMTDAVQCGGWVWRGLAVWHKPGIRMHRGRFSASAEFLVYASNGPVTDGGRSQQNVFAFPPVSGDDKQHIAEKPDAVVAWAMDVAPAGVSILDPFMGSGTTLAVAKRTGRQAIGVEIEERYCEIAAKRLAQQVMFA